MPARFRAGPRVRSKARPVVGPRAIREVVIDRLGARGDGIATVEGAPVFVPRTLPGDRVRVRMLRPRGGGVVAQPLERIEEVDRAAPPCPHFGTCGGCQLQHVPPAMYVEWQRGQVVDAFARQGLGDVPVRPLQIGRPGRRRRARLGFARHDKAVRLGFRQGLSHRLIDLAACPVLLPEIVSLVAPLRSLLGELEMAARPGELQVSATRAGPDCLIAAADAQPARWRGDDAPSLADRERLAAFAHEHDVARIAWQGRAAPPETVIERRPPWVAFGGVRVTPPPGAFLQASEDAEAAIDAAVDAAIAGATRIADLFAGCGTFGLPRAAAGATVHAVEGDEAMLGAVVAAARSLGGRLTVERRDLEHAPLTPAELQPFDAVIVDPPRAGARPQAAALAASGVPRVAMVSCHPASCARDARALIEGGYRCRWVQPIDAFLWSSRIELVAALEREPSAG